MTQLLLFAARILPVIALVFMHPVHAQQKQATAILAGGCFWCVESDFEKLDGVYEVISGYIGGHVQNPSYQQVTTGTTGHIEAAIIKYDPDKFSYADILDHFWKTIDPTTDKGQFCDIGPQYRPAIFYQNDQQKEIAEQSYQQLSQNKPFEADLKVELLKADTFYPAEEYHQDYYKKNPLRYKFYRYSCGRDARLQELWGESVGR